MDKSLMVKLFNVPISITSLSGALAIITQWVMERHEARSAKHEAESDVPRATRHVPRAKVISTPNPEMIVAAQKDPEFLRALQEADLAIPDGIGVVLALRILADPNDPNMHPNSPNNFHSEHSD